MFAKPQMVLVIFLGLSRSSDLTQCWGAGCATGPRGTGALPSSNGCAIPLLEGLKPISLSILQWAAEGHSASLRLSHRTSVCLYKEEPLCGSKVALHQKDACALIVSPFDVNLGP